MSNEIKAYAKSNEAKIITEQAIATLAKVHKTHPAVIVHNLKIKNPAIMKGFETLIKKGLEIAGEGKKK